MSLNIDKNRHFKTVTCALFNAIAGIERLHKENGLTEIIDIAVDWFETGNLLAYTFFNDAIRGKIEDPTDFYSGLGSFLANCILDDSYFAVKWKKYDTHTGNFMDGGEPWKDDPYVVWTGDDDPKATCNSEVMLEAMKFAIKKEEERRKKWEEWEKFKEENL